MCEVITTCCCESEILYGGKEAIEDSLCYSPAKSD